MKYTRSESSEGLRPSSWSNGPGERYAPHDHGYDKVIVVERGSIAFGLPASAVVIAAPASAGRMNSKVFMVPRFGRYAFLRTCWMAVTIF